MKIYLLILTLMLFISTANATMEVIEYNKTEIVYNKTFNFVVFPDSLNSNRSPPNIENFTFNIVNQEANMTFEPRIEFFCTNNANGSSCCKDYCMLTTNITPVYPFEQKTHLVKCIIPADLNWTTNSSCGVYVSMDGYNNSKNISILLAPEIPTDKEIKIGVVIRKNFLTSPLICFAKTCYYNTMAFWDIVENPPVIGNITLDSINLLEIIVVVLIIMVLCF